MTLFLASVRDSAEADMALLAGADVIDLKEPGRGALGALDPEALVACVASVGGRRAVSATIGDLPLDGPGVRDAVRETASAGVDFVKVGLFPGARPEACLSLLKDESARARLILVLFADALPAFDAISVAAEIGAHGVMLDTADKGSGSLLAHMSLGEVADFVGAARLEGLTAGLAGSLKAADIVPLLALEPELLGFRGALCREGARRGAVDKLACRRIRALIPPASGARPHRTEPRASALC
ncbi:MAG: (5-formylfuran-3-yl)methyl phosphate synthase [Methyloceanibacter sp.]